MPKEGDVIMFPHTENTYTVAQMICLSDPRPDDDWRNYSLINGTLLGYRGNKVVIEFDRNNDNEPKYGR